MSELLDRLNSGDILICDGSTGVRLQSMGCGPGESVEKWGLENEDILRELHRGYIEAGADIILTNTLGGTGLKLKKYGLESEVESLNKGLAMLALDEASKATKTVYVAGNVGPTGEFMEPIGLLTEADMIKAFSQQIKILVEGGVDLIFIETMMDISEAVSAVKSAKNSCDLPVFASMSYNPDRNGFRTIMGGSPQKAVELLQESGADVVGANCGSVFAGMMPDLIRQMKEAGARLVVVEPNAGMPEAINGKTIFPQTPQEMSDSVPAMIDAGANVIGGCCGTNEKHIHLIARTVHEYVQRKLSE